MKLSFQRITSSGSFIPEIDGFRFIAIASVVLYHLGLFIIAKDSNHYEDSTDYNFLKQILLRGHLGVPLFFVISGFILGLPFANQHIAKSKPVQLKKYFIRRLTRLEPPYIVSMTILLFGAVFVAGTFSLSEGILSYLSSIIYCNNFIYSEKFFTLNGVAWSLEIEVQFYILAPLLAYVFAISSSRRRLFFCCISIVFLIFSHYNNFVFRSLLDYMQFFLAGFILADLYISKVHLFPKTKYDSLIALLLFVSIWLFNVKELELTHQKVVWETIQLVAIFFFYYYVLFHKVFKFLSWKPITNIGGMCYSIYLLHFPIISMLGNPLVKLSLSKYSFVNVSIYCLILVAAVLLISSIFFLLIERPCMDKDWYKKFLSPLPKLRQHRVAAKLPEP